MQDVTTDGTGARSGDEPLADAGRVEKVVAGKFRHLRSLVFGITRQADGTRLVGLWMDYGEEKDGIFQCRLGVHICDSYVVEKKGTARKKRFDTVQQAKNKAEKTEKGKR